MYSPFRMFLHDAFRMLRKIIIKIIAFVLFLALSVVNLVFKLVAFARGLVFPVIGMSVTLAGIFSYIEFKTLMRTDILIYSIIVVSCIGLYFVLPILVDYFEEYVLAELKFKAFAPLVVRSRLKFTL